MKKFEVTVYNSFDDTGHDVVIEADEFSLHNQGTLVFDKKFQVEEEEPDENGNKKTFTYNDFEHVAAFGSGEWRSVRLIDEEEEPAEHLLAPQPGDEILTTAAYL